jgi:hypothetical protein
MNIAKLINQCEIRLDYLRTQLLSYNQLGNIEMILKLETEIAETEQTIAMLKNS